MEKEGYSSLNVKLSAGSNFSLRRSISSIATRRNGILRADNYDLISQSYTEGTQSAFLVGILAVFGVLLGCALLVVLNLSAYEVQQHLTGGGWQKSSQNFQKRGFSAAAGTDDGRKCTVFKGQVAISEGVNRAFPFPVGFGDLYSFQNFIFHKMSPLDAFLRIKEKIGSNAADSQNTISRMLTMI